MQEEEEGKGLISVESPADSSKTCAGRCFCCFGSCCIAYVIVTILFTAVAWQRGFNNCGIQAFDVQDVIARDPQMRPVVSGTTSNSPDFGVNLTGLWWIRWRDESLSIRVYNHLRCEELVTFADSTVNSTKFPLSDTVYAMRPHHWGYSSYIGGKITMIGHAWTWFPEGRQRFRFANDTFARLTDYATFVNLNDDEWLRPSNLSSGVFTYSLTRIAYDNGDGLVASTWWPNFEQHMWPWNVLVWGSNSAECRRRCESIVSLLFPLYASCGLCVSCDWSS